MRKFKCFLEAASAIVSAGLLAIQLGQTLPLNVAFDTQKTAIVFTLKA